MAEPYRNPPTGQDPNRTKMRRMLVLAGGVALVIILVAVIAGMSGGGRKMSDGSDGSADDPELKEISGGVKYRDLKEGTGEPCPHGAKVRLSYSGWLTDGTVFDSSKGQSVEFALNGLIKGWQVGIPGMKPGGIRKLVIPPDKGYGSQAKGKIPAGSTLIFEVELIEVVPGPKPPTGPGRPMSDGSDGGTEDPALSPIGSAGLKYRDLKEGTGDAVKPGVSVTVHYTGWLVNGHPFDSSKKRGEPITFSLNEVVRGWKEGIPGMKPGGIRKLVIPPSLGYGDQDKGDIPPNSTLIFEVELIR